MQDFDRALFRTADGLAASRWSVAAAAERGESRGMHVLTDAPETRPDFAHRLIVGGFDSLWTRPDASASEAPRLERATA